MSQVILPTKAFRPVLEKEMVCRRVNWSEENWGAPTPERVEEVARNTLAASKVYEYPTRGLRDDLREFIALRIAPWLRSTPNRQGAGNGR